MVDEPGHKPLSDQDLLDAAAERAGGFSKLAEALGLTKKGQAKLPYVWKTRVKQGRQLSPDKRERLSRLIGVAGPAAPVARSASIRVKLPKQVRELLDAVQPGQALEPNLPEHAQRELQKKRREIERQLIERARELHEELRTLRRALVAEHGPKKK